MAADRRPQDSAHAFAPLKVAGLQKPLDVFIDLDAAMIDDVLRRLTELRTRQG